MNKARTSIKFRIVAILCVVLISTLLVSVFSAYQFFWPSFQKIEQSLAKQNAARVKNAVLHDLENLEAFVADWALWDDSYAFVQGPTDAYIRSNLSPETFWQNELSGIGYLDDRGKVVWARSYDYKTDELTDFPEQVAEFVAHTLRARGQLPEDGMLGLVRIGDEFALMGTMGIQDSRNQEPPIGALIMLRRFEENYLDRLRYDTRSFVYVRSMAEVNEAKDETPDAILDNKVRTVWFELPIINDTQSLRFYVETSRTITETAIRALSSDVVAVALGSLLVFIVMLLLLEQQVIRPLSILSRGLIARQQNPMARIGLDRLRDDEIGLIAQEIDRLQTKIIEMALKDDLTGLPNRRLFDDRLEQAVEQADRRKTKVAVLFIDLDGFKPVNDKFGHQQGDRLLEMVADRFRHTVRNSDTLARFGGDEFAMVVEFRKDARLGLEVLCRKLVQQLEKLFQVQNSYVRISASIGCAIYPDQAHDTVELLRMADEAMYEVKNSGKNAWRIHGGKQQPEADDDDLPAPPNSAMR